jgi:hypothetical protein
MIKITDKHEVTPFGRLHLIHEQVIAKKLPQFINKHLGSRRHNAKYSYSDLILNMCYIAFFGGDCAEDVSYVHNTF